MSPSYYIYNKLKIYIQYVKILYFYICKFYVLSILFVVTQLFYRVLRQFAITVSLRMYIYKRISSET